MGFSRIFFSGGRVSVCLSLPAATQSRQCGSAAFEKSNFVLSIYMEYMKRLAASPSSLSGLASAPCHFGTLGGPNRQSLVFSKRGQLSMAIPQFHVEQHVTRMNANRSTMNAGSMRTNFCVSEGDSQRTLVIRIAAIALASDSAITIARFCPSKFGTLHGVVPTTDALMQCFPHQRPAAHHRRYSWQQDETASLAMILSHPARTSCNTLHVKTDLYDCLICEWHDDINEVFLAKSSLLTRRLRDVQREGKEGLSKRGEVALEAVKRPSWAPKSHSKALPAWLVPLGWSNHVVLSAQTVTTFPSNPTFLWHHPQRLLFSKILPTWNMF